MSLFTSSGRQWEKLVIEIKHVKYIDTKYTGKIIEIKWNFGFIAKILYFFKLIICKIHIYIYIYISLMSDVLCFWWVIRINCNAFVFLLNNFNKKQIVKTVLFMYYLLCIFRCLNLPSRFFWSQVGCYKSYKVKPAKNSMYYHKI